VNVSSKEKAGPQILLVEDSPGEVRLAQQAFRAADASIPSHIAGDGVESYPLQANCCLTKPVNLDEFETLVRSINDFWLTKVRLPN
jgi:hypothetical protein